MDYQSTRSPLPALLQEIGGGVMPANRPIITQTDRIRYLEEQLRRCKGIINLHEDTIVSCGARARKFRERRDQWRERYEAKAAEFAKALELASQAYSMASWVQATKQDVRDALLPLLKKHRGENHESRLEERIANQRRELARLSKYPREGKPSPIRSHEGDRPADLLFEDEREFVEERRQLHGRRYVHGHLLDIIDRLAPKPVEVPDAE